MLGMKPLQLVMIAALAACVHQSHTRQAVLVTPDDSHVTVTFKSGTTVSNMSVGASVVIPASCDPPLLGPLKALCTPAFRHLAHDKGTREPRLIDTLANDAGTTYVFAAVFDGSGECGTYGFWIMRVDKTIHISQPIEGCFAFSEEDADHKSPVVVWGPPLRVVVQDEASAHSRTYALDERTFTLTPRSP